MRRDGLSFDEARYAMVQMQMRSMGIDPNTGLPVNDSKAVSFSSSS
jgi:hypothetical protein